jgi:hypothetical protein
MSAPGTKQTYESGAVLSAQQHNKDVPGMKGPLTWAEAHHASLSDLWLRTTPRAKFSTDESPVSSPYAHSYRRTRPSSDCCSDSS